MTYVQGFSHLQYILFLMKLSLASFNKVVLFLELLIMRHYLNYTERFC